MKVTLRKKPAAKGRHSLYLDYYPPFVHPESGKKTRWEMLKIYVFDKPKTELEKNHNRQTMALAENVRAIRQIEVQNSRFGFVSDEKRNESFVEYFRKQVRKKKGTNFDNWSMALRYFVSYAGEDFPFSKINISFCEEFRDYLLSGPGISRRKSPISNNTAVSYYAKFRALLKPAFRAGLLTVNLYEITDGIKERETHREYLTMDEFQKLFDTESKDPLIKNAAIFSGLTGLRFSDIKALDWSEVRGASDNYYIQFHQVKTQGAETMPISDEVFALLGTRQPDRAKVFGGLKYSRVKPFLVDWLEKAGIHKNVTFHSFRHTYATLQISAGTDIYTVSKMLGHRNVKTTQIYAKVIDEKKREATNRIKLKIK